MRNYDSHVIMLITTNDEMSKGGLVSRIKKY